MRYFLFIFLCTLLFGCQDKVNIELNETSPIDSALFSIINKYDLPWQYEEYDSIQNLKPQEVYPVYKTIAYNKNLVFEFRRWIGGPIEKVLEIVIIKAGNKLFTIPFYSKFGFEQYIKESGLNYAKPICDEINTAAFGLRSFGYSYDAFSYPQYLASFIFKNCETLTMRKILYSCEIEAYKSRIAKNTRLAKLFEYEPDAIAALNKLVLLENDSNCFGYNAMRKKTCQLYGVLPQEAMIFKITSTDSVISMEVVNLELHREIHW